LWRVTHAPYKIISDKFALPMLVRSPALEEREAGCASTPLAGLEDVFIDFQRTDF